jgi:RecB family exonuclease
VCHRASDDDGAALAPSPLVSWLERGGVRGELFHSAPLMGTPVTERERALALVAVAPERAAQLAPHAARVAARERVRETLHAGAPRELGALAPSADVRALLEMETGGGARPLAVTALERIARCPFQGFASQLFGALGDDPRTDDAPDRREEGILAHEALGAAFTAAEPFWSARPRDRRAIEEAARVASNAVLARAGGALVRASLERIRLEVDRIVSLAIEDEDWDFAWAERGFGNAGDEWPAFVLEDTRGRVALRGRIDRLDVSAQRGVANDTAPTAVRAVDYKRRVSLPAIVELGASAIQVPLYAIVARRNLAVKDARGRYLSTISPAKNATSSFEDRFAELVEEDAAHASEVTRAALDRVHALRAGDVAPVPTAPKWCATCGLDGACRRPRFAVTMIGREEQE